MFGFLSSRCPPREWRQAYARVCQHQRKNFGLIAVPFLSYEAVFLYQLMVDSGLVPWLDVDAPVCCRLRTRSECSPADDYAGQFVSAFGMMLLKVKLEDDLKDSGRVIHRLLWWLCRESCQHAEQQLEFMSPGLRRSLSNCLEQHSELENAESSVTLEQAMRPTGDALAAVFQGAYGISNSPIRSHDSAVDAHGHAALIDVRQFSQTGRHLGRAIIAWDCAVDFENDQALGQFNPLTSSADVSEAFSVCQDEIRSAASLCPEGSTSRSFLLQVCDRVAERAVTSGRVCSASRLERWGFIRQRGYSYAHCDGCEAGCAALECSECCLTSGDLGLCMISDPCCTGCGSNGSSSSAATGTSKSSERPKSPGQSKSAKDSGGSTADGADDET